MLPSDRDHISDEAATDCRDSSDHSQVYCDSSTEGVRWRQSALGRWFTGTAKKQDWTVAAIIALIILCFFAKTVFLGAPISRISLLPEWDSLFSASWTGKGGNYDPSLVQLLVPYYFLVAKMWHCGQLPLWNPYSGFGVPLIGDLQAAVFSPVHLLFNLFPTMYVYNLTLVLEVVLAALGTFALARALRLPRYAAVFASLAYALCPFNLYYLELNIGTAACLFPGLFWLFVRLASNPTVSRSVIAGTSCAVLICSGHPESAFFAITMASALMVTLILWGTGNSSPMKDRLMLAGRSLLLAGCVAFCLSAPVLLPFVEYLANCDSYKLSIGGSTWVPWQGITYNLLLPGFGAASPYLGVLAATVLPLALLTGLRAKRALSCLIIWAAIALCITARLGPLDSLLRVKPFNCLITVYFLPIFLLLAAVICASGLQELVERTKPGFNARFLCLGATVAAVIMIPCLFYACHIPLHSGDFDLMLPHMAVNKPALIQQSSLLAALMIVYLLCKSIRSSPRWVLPVALLAVSFTSQALAAKGTLPVTRHFAYPVVQPIPFLQSKNERMVALGNHLCKPNTSAVYGFHDIRAHNPLFPARYLDFLKRAGARVDMFNQLFDSASSSLLDLGSVRYVLSLDPPAGAEVTSTDHSLDQKHLFSTPQGINVYERKSYRPRAYLVHQTIAVRSGEEALHLVSAAQFNPRVSAVIETQPAITFAISQQSSFDKHSVPVAASQTNSIATQSGRSSGQQQTGSSTGDLSGGSSHSDHSSNNDTVSLIRPGPTSLIIETNSNSPGTLVLTDTYYPGWQATVDGQQAPLLRANYLFRAVNTPAGKHHVEFLYRPFSFYLGVFLISSYLMVMILAQLLLQLRRRRASDFSPS